jgi:hypothetical protein
MMRCVTPRHLSMQHPRQRTRSLSNTVGKAGCQSVAVWHSLLASDLGLTSVPSMSNAATCTQEQMLLLSLFSQFRCPHTYLL